MPPLEGAVVSNVRLTDNSGNPLAIVAVGKQVRVTGQAAVGQEADQACACLVQINDASDVTLSLAWTSGAPNAGQAPSPSPPSCSATASFAHALAVSAAVRPCWRLMWGRGGNA